MTDAANAIEQAIQAKGKTAPRVTPTHIEALIQQEYYFTAEQGVKGMAQAGFVQPLHPSLKCMTFCVLVLDNGFTVTGTSACASPENFDAEIGRKIARVNAIEQIWQLEGYLLKQRLHEGEFTAA